MSFSQATEWRAALCAALLLMIGVFTPQSGAIAGMVSLSPLRVYFDGDRQSGVVRIKNTGDDTIYGGEGIDHSNSSSSIRSSVRAHQ